MAATDARPVPRKNAAYRFYFAIRKPSDSTLITTWAGQDSEVSLDGAAYSDCTSEATEIGTTGTGYIDLTASEMNADCVLLKVTVTNTGAVPLVFALYPEESGDYRADMTLISGDSTAADNAEAFFDGTGYAGTNNVIPLVTTTTTATNVTTVNGLAANVITAASIAADAVTEIQSGLATAANLATVAGYLDTEIAAILADTNELQTDWADGGRLDMILDSRSSQTSVDTIDDFLDTEVAAIKAKTDNLPASPAATGDIPTTAQIFAAVLTSQLTEAYAADGTAPTLAQAIFLIQQSLHEFAISGTTRTVRKLDGSTTAATFTLDSSTAPTSTTRAS